MRIGGMISARRRPPQFLIRPYLEHYQRGAGILPAFSGSVYQEGNGFGDVMKSVVRAFLPMATRGAANFLEGTARNFAQGKSLSQAAETALAPRAMRMMKRVVMGPRADGYQRFGRRPQKRRGRYFDDDDDDDDYEDVYEEVSPGYAPAPAAAAPTARAPRRAYARVQSLVSRRTPRRSRGGAIRRKPQKGRGGGGQKRRGRKTASSKKRVYKRCHKKRRRISIIPTNF